jgi:hypothetical protein
MSDDFVTRLRYNAAHLRRMAYTGIGEQVDKAADEIERLRKENAELLADLQQVHEEHRW